MAANCGGAVGSFEASRFATGRRNGLRIEVNGSLGSLAFDLERLNELELYEAASIDGASAWTRFRYITLPLLTPVILIVTMFSVIFTFADFQLVYVLTHGGPANATNLFATYAFDIAMSGGQLGRGASVALAMLPTLGVVIIALTIYMRRRQ